MRAVLSRRVFLAALGPAIAACSEAAPGSGETSRSSTTPISGSGASASATTPPAATPSASGSERPPARQASSAEAPRSGGAVRARAIEVRGPGGGLQSAVIVEPDWGAEGDRFPLLVALHGLGETKKGTEAGPWGWVKDYWLDRAARRLRAPPLTRADFQGLVSRDRLAKINASLAERPFRGLVVACPFTPDLLQARSLDNVGPFADFVVTRLIPRVREQAPVIGAAGSGAPSGDARSATGIDGVSLGGRLSLLAALGRPEAFGAVGVMQGAFELREVDEVAARTRATQPKGTFRLRLMTSAGDFYRGATAELDKALSKVGVAHEHVVLPGPHDYVWNRGPGAIEMLLWHDRVLRGEAPEP